VTSPPLAGAAPAWIAARQIAESPVYTSLPQVAPVDAQPAGHRIWTVSPISRLMETALNEQPASIGPPELASTG